MDFMASNSYRSACRRPWQKSMDSQEFGFASNLMNSMEVATADELFFKGLLLPLQMDPRLHLVQALSGEQGSYSRGEPSRISYWSQDEEVIEYNSCGMGCEAGVPCVESKTAAIASSHVNDSMVDQCRPLLARGTGPVSSQQGFQREPSMFSWCEGEELLSCKVEGDMGLDSKDLITLDQATPCDQVNRPTTPRGGSRLSFWHKDEEMKDPCLSSWNRDEEISLEGDVDADFKASMHMDLRSSSFRSQNSEFWESGADKDTGDSSSSSRDSNGSSQDSYFPSNTTLEKRASAMHSLNARASFHTLWKSLLRKASNKATPSSSQAISRMGYSEDLSKYKEFNAKEAKEAMRPWKLDSIANAEDSKSYCIQDKKDKDKGIPSSNDKSTSGFKSKSVICNAAKEDVITHMSTTMSKSLMNKGKGGRDDDKGEMKRKQRSAAIKEKWQGYARRLRPLYEMKRGLMGQFRMDECGRKACEVESGNIYAAMRPMERRLSHQVSLFESHKLLGQEQNQVYVLPHKGSNMLAMSSCPPSTRSSPNHSGVLAVMEPKQTHANKFNVKINNNRAFPSSNYTSMSTVHELHSSLQSAITHCKESNKRLDCRA